MNLKNLSDETLLSQLKTLVSEEREILVQVLRHLKEIERRKLHLERGYPSLWAYCTKELGYSEAGAQRRIEAMRAIRELPAIESKIESGTLSLSVVAKVQSVLRKQAQPAPEKDSNSTGGKLDLISREQKLELFSLFENKSQKEADDLLAEKFGEPATSQHESIRSLTNDLYEMRLVLSSDQLKFLEQARSFLSHSLKSNNWAELLEVMAKRVIAKHVSIKPDLARECGSRRKELQKNNLNSSVVKLAAESIVQVPPSQPSPPQRRWGRVKSRYLPAATRRLVWERAQGACEYRDSTTGRRCSGRHRLEVEHVQPIAFGGGHAPDNLLLYCRAHNQLAAEHATLKTSQTSGSTS